MSALSPRVTIVFLVFNRREQLRTSLRQMLVESDYDAGRVEVVVVDNASTDGSAEMVRSGFPEVRLIRRGENSGVSGINDGFAVATGEWVLGLDDDCYLPPDGLRRAVAAAAEHRADLVSFGVVSSTDPDLRFDWGYRTGLLSYWGCAVLIRRAILDELGGYDPAIFVWANELEFMVRFFDRAFRHLHLPDVVAVHMKPDLPTPREYVSSFTYLMNSRHFAYVAGKLLQPRDALGALVAVLANIALDSVQYGGQARRGVPAALRGFRDGVRRRQPVHPEVSATYRREFLSFLPPWRVSRGPWDPLLSLPVLLYRAVRGLPPADVGRREAYLSRRTRYYPTRAATLELGPRAA